MLNYALLCGLWAVFFAQWMKVPVYYYKEKVWDWNLVFSTGSMPSSHTAFVIGTATAVAVIDGFYSTTFAIAAVVSIITVHDAIKVRGESGKQAAVLNELQTDLKLIYETLNLANSSQKRDAKLKELIGHTNSEVLGGVFVGILTAIIFLNLNNVL